MLERWLVAHTRLALAASAVIAVSGLAYAEFPITTQLVLLAALVAVLGLPHGAVDHWQGRTLLAGQLGAAWPLAFGAGYLATTALVVLAWVSCPPLLLVGFLLLAAGHFGSEDVMARPAIRDAGPLGRSADIALRGSLPVLLPLGFHPGETAGLFAALMPGTTAAELDPLLNAMALFSPVYFAVLGGWLVVATINREPLTGAEIAVHTATFAVLPPLLAFSTYFCLWHSPRHSLMVIAEAGHTDLAAGVKRFVRDALLLTGLTIAGGAAAFYILQERFSSAEATLQVVFVGLAALTLPHVLLPLMRRYRRAGSEGLQG
jgi:Brp/Blh family beta-carotene 15,15'-monooxygenase